MKIILLAAVATLVFQSSIASAQNRCMSEEQGYRAGSNLGDKGYSDPKHHHLSEAGRNMGRNFCKECSGIDRHKCHRGWVDGALGLPFDGSDFPKKIANDGCLGAKEATAQGANLGPRGCDPVTDSPNDFGQALCQTLCIECSSTKEPLSKHEACISGCTLGERKACKEHARKSGGGGSSESPNATPAN